MHINGDVITWSASDITAASSCEFAFLRALDARQGRLSSEEPEPDAMLERTGQLGAVHEQRLLEEYRGVHGTGVVVIPRPSLDAGITTAEARHLTRKALGEGAPIVAQAALDCVIDHSRFVGYADFLVRQPDGAYRVEDTKLARSEKVSALLQLAAYAEALLLMGFHVAPAATLVLGDGRRVDYAVADVAPVLALRRDRLLHIVRERETEAAAGVSVVEWGDERYAMCGACDACAAEVAATDDVLQVATLTRGQREKLRAEGIATVEQLASSTGDVAGMGMETLARLRDQARLQSTAVPGEAPPYEVADPEGLSLLPPPSDGDIFFDFEGDPLYSEDEGAVWGLDYLWGWVNAEGDFKCLWAHDFASEREALRCFMETIRGRRAAYPDMHIYHYAPYERTHLFSMAARWGIGEDEVDDLFRDDVLVDLYAVVRRALRVGSPSYSIKKLEPLYMGDEHREGVDNAGDSIVEYALACEARDAGDVEGFQRRLADIEQYNAYDCVSTLRLRDWLLELAREAGVALRAVADAPDEVAAERGPSELEVALQARAEGATGADAMAYRIASAAVDFHRRERKGFWHDHFSRLVAPKADWADTRDVFDVAHGELLRDWFKEGRQRTHRRHMRLHGVAAPGSRFAGGMPYALYDDAPYTSDAAPGNRTAHLVSVLEEGDGWVDIEETEKSGQTWGGFPTALTPGRPIPTASIEAAIAEWGTSVAQAVDWPSDPASNLLRRIPPAVEGEIVASTGPDDIVGPLVASLLNQASGYLAVQGPPGTGKTYLGSHTIAKLVADHGWKVGVVAQSHAVVDNMLNAVVGAGLSAALVGKVDKQAGGTVRYTRLPTDGHAAFADTHPEGYVLGGTAWDMTNTKRVAREQFDLLVIDEAGQFSLANTIASAQSAKRLLLLGDPQQLPAVTQGTHPAPVDTPALEWLSAGSDVLPAEFGYFLPQSRRMDRAVAAPVSALSYAGELSAHSCTEARRLHGIEPGVVAVPVEHRGNSTSSPEEADAVVRLIREVLGTPWNDPDEGRRDSPLTGRDVIVVTPYNAQRAEVLAALEAAGLTDVRVGTVDKFQGQEAVVAIVTLAASSAGDVPRGLEFLINRNRLNVAISRAKWAARLVYSPGLLAHLPSSPQRLVELGRFARLVGIAPTREKAARHASSGEPLAADHLDAAWREALDLCASDLEREVVTIASGIPGAIPPELGLEVLRGDMAVIAWPARRIVVDGGWEGSVRPRLQSEGWNIVSPEPSSLIVALSEESVS